MMLDKITTHTTDAQARLLNQYSDKLKILSLFKIFGDMVQDAENYFYNSFGFYNIDIAEGLWLDVLGATVGQNREVFSIGVGDTAFLLDTSYLDSATEVLDGVTSRLDDIQYRRYIYATIFKNFVRNKNVEEIYKLIDRIIEPELININEYTAKVSITVDLGGDTQKYRIINSLIANNPNWVGVPAGVQIEWSLVDYK